MATLSHVAPSRRVAPAQARAACATTLRSNVRSEAIRLLRPGFVGIGLLAGAAVVALFALGIFLAAADQPGSRGPGPRGPNGFASLADLEAPAGIVEAVKSANNFLAIVVMTWVAIAVAGDYASGLVRLLVQAEPRRWRLLAGKFAVLAGLTILAAAVAVVASLIASPLVASTQDVSTARWGTDSLGPVLETLLNLSGGLLVWAALAFAVAVLTRSVAVAIAGAIAYALVIENVLIAVVGGLEGWLPGAAIQAMVDGGNDAMGYGRAVALALAYALAALAVSLAVFQRRDITA